MVILSAPALARLIALDCSIAPALPGPHRFSFVEGLSRFLPSNWSSHPLFEPPQCLALASRWDAVAGAYPVCGLLVQLCEKKCLPLFEKEYYLLILALHFFLLFS